MDRKQQIVEYLYQQKKRVSSSQLSAALAIPRRSLIRYIQDLNLMVNGLISADNSGYLLDESRYSDYLKEKGSEEDRIRKIINHLLFSKTETDLYDLSAALFVSETTLLSDLKKARSVLSRYSLKLDNEKGVLKIEGSERNKRQLIKSYIYGEISDGSITLENMSDYFPDFDINAIKKAILDTTTEYGLYLDDFTLFSILLHVVVKMERNIYDSAILDTPISDQQKKESFYQISSSFCKKLEELMSFSFSDAEIYELGLLLSASLHNIDQEKESIEYLSEDIYRLSNEILSYIREYYDLELDYDGFRQSFSLHLKNLISRLSNHIQVQNPLKDELKRMYPFVYEISFDILNSFVSGYGSISEDETAYIVLHIASQIDKNEALNSKLRCTLISPDFYSLNKKLLVRLKSEFESSIYIDNVYSSYDALDKAKTSADLIVSTQQIPEAYRDRSIRVNILLPKEDVERLNHYIEKRIRSRMFEQFRQYLSQYISENHFAKFEQDMNYDDAILYASKQLLSEGMIPEDFAGNCIDREQISSTNFKDIAIPHPALSNAYRSTVYVLTSSKNFLWTNGNKVKTVFLLAIRKEDILLFKPLFDFISYYISCSDLYDLFTDIGSCEELISKISKVAQER